MDNGIYIQVCKSGFQSQCPQGGRRELDPKTLTSNLTYTHTDTRARTHTHTDPILLHQN